MDQIRDILRKFASDRDWEQFHTPENLAKSVSIEAGELLECFQWGDDFDLQAVSDEIADVMCYCIMLADAAGIDLRAAILDKIRRNAIKYPVEECRGSSEKYDKLRSR